MDRSALHDDQQALLVESLTAAEKATARVQARRAQLMVQFADTRKTADQHRIHELEAEGGRPRYQPGEFAAMEIGLALTASKPTVKQEVTRARRLQTEAPDAWDAWIAGDINQAKAHQISRALRKLQRDDSKKMLNAVVVHASLRRTPELLRRWLNRFIARVEPDLADERIRRSLDDRYVSVRPDLDGVSFLSACLPSLDAASIDLVLDALVGIIEPGDPRTRQQVRADALVDLLLGRISNGWQPTDAEESDARPTHQIQTTDPTPPDTQDDRHDDGWDLPASAYRPDPTPADDDAAAATVNESDDDAEPADDGELTDPTPTAVEHPEPTDGIGHSADVDPDADGARPGGSAEGTTDCRPGGAPTESADAAAAGPGGNGRQHPPPRVAIGVVVSFQSLFGYTDTPGELADGSAHIPADIIRTLAEQTGTLFYRLLTDPAGHLLDITEVGRFPSGKLAAAVGFRDPMCTNPTCHTTAHRCDLDHTIPWPDGPTAAANLGPACRPDHRAKTHAGFGITRTGNQTTWTTPTGHRYTTEPDPLPVENWPAEPPDTG